MTILQRTFTVCVLITIMPVFLHAQIKVNGYYDGYWGEWEDAGIASVYGGIDYSYPYLKVYGNYDGFCTYTSDSHPSSYTFKFQITNYFIPDKKTRKAHLKSNRWYEFSGVVEYNVNDELPTIKDILKRSSALGRFPVIHPALPGARKRTANATIKIAPYKDHPKVYNIFFEGVAVGIDLNTIYFIQ